MGDSCPLHMCQPYTTVAYFLFLASLPGLLVFFILTIFWQGKPLKQLGQRPLGYGLYSYYFNDMKDNVGVWGYDPVLGSLSMSLRVRIHSIACLMLISFVTLIWPKDQNDEFLILSTIAKNMEVFAETNNYWFIKNSQCWLFVVPNEVLLVMIIVTSSYALYFHIVNNVMEAVSDPGGPREHKIQRVPQWENKNIQFPISTSAIADKTKNSINWRCSVAQESHSITSLDFEDSKGKLTGEPRGRQMWTTRMKGDDDTVKNAVAVDEERVQKMACGGRSYQGAFNPSINPNSCDMIFRAQQIRNYISSGKKLLPEEKEKETTTTIKDAIYKGGHFYSMLQTEDGHWAGDYGGPHFLMPGLIAVWYAMGKPKEVIDIYQAQLMKHYIIVHQQVDGGWGTHLESPSTMFGTILMYVALRLLIGTNYTPNSDDDEDYKKLYNDVLLPAQKFIEKNGGALMTSSWAKFYLCILGLMEWDGHNSVPPEMFLLPNWFPFHPGRMWCHARMVYLPMGYLYGRRFVYKDAETDPLILSLRKELYPNQSYEKINWIVTRHMVADMDNYSPLPFIMENAQNLLAYYETLSFVQPIKNFIRKYGLKFSIDYIYAEDLQTNFIDIGPVNKVLNMLSVFDHVNGNIEHEKIQNHMMRIRDYLWVAEDGMKMQGYNGSQCWDTSFAIQAYYESNLLDTFPDVSTKVYEYLERTQILSTEVSMKTPAYKYESNKYRKQFYRHASKGGWPFSTSAHGWPISDCTGEGLKGVFALLKSKTVLENIENGTLKSMGPERLYDAINVLLTYQNEDGGWATYENNRGFRWYEQLNPSEVFGDIMIDYSYVECSMASLTAIVEFHELYPDHRKREVLYAINRGKKFLTSIQRPDGSWYGSWACCFCYGCWFGVEGLVKCGETIETSDAIKKACEFLLKHQRPNGGWGEDFTSCYDKAYAEKGMDAYGCDGSGVVNTSWALLALSIAKCKDVEAVRRGVKFLISRQLPCGDWPQEGIAGVFNRACGITYTAYRNVFPLWALGRCTNQYGEDAFKDI